MKLISGLGAGFKKGSAAILDQGIVSGTNFITVILLAKYLGVEGLGKYTLLWLAVLFVHSLQLGFIISPMQNLSAKFKENNHDDYFSSMLFIQILFTLIASLCSGVFAYLTFGFQFVFPLMISVAGYTMNEYMRRYFFIKQKMNRALLIDITNNSLQLAVLIFFWLYLKTDVAVVLYIIGTLYCFTGLLGLFFYNKIKINLRFTFKIFYDQLKFSGWLIGTSLMQWFAGNYVLVIAGAIAGNLVLGIVRIVQNIMGLFHVLFLVLENHLPQKASFIFHEQGKEKLFSFMKKVALYAGLVFFLLLLAVACTSKYIIFLIYGLNDPIYSLMLQAFCPLYVLIFFGNPLRFTLLAQGLTNHVFIGNFLAVLFNLTCSALLVKSLGVWGVVVVLGISQLLMQFWYVVAITFKINFSWKLFT